MHHEGWFLMLDLASVLSIPVMPEGCQSFFSTTKVRCLWASVWAAGNVSEWVRFIGSIKTHPLLLEHWQIHKPTPPFPQIRGKYLLFCFLPLFKLRLKATLRKLLLILYKQVKYQGNLGKENRSQVLWQVVVFQRLLIRVWNKTFIFVKYNLAYFSPRPNLNIHHTLVNFNMVIFLLSDLLWILSS